MDVLNVTEYLRKMDVNKSIQEPNDRQPVYLEGRWHFWPELKDSTWHTIKVPSFWNTPEQFEHEENWKKVHEAWYGYSFSFDKSSLKSQDLFLCFRGVSLLCDIYINGQYVGSHGGRFTPFEFKINDFVKINAVNTLAVYVKDLSHALSEDKQALYYSVGLMNINGHVPDPFMADHPPFGGIWQPVYLEKRPSARVEQLQVITSVRQESIKNKIDLYSDKSLKITVKNYVYSVNDNTIEFSLPENEVSLQAGETTRVLIEAGWSEPRLWSAESPDLYNMVTELYDGEILLDRKVTRFGFREFWIEGSDFYLNGIKTKLFGESINMVQQILCSNYRKDYIKLLFKTLKEQLNINCLRLHSMIAPQVMVQCADEVGILIIDQSGIWSSAGMHYTRGGQKFLENTKKEFHEWILRDINSPSVVIWDVENEILRGTYTKLWALELDSYVKEIDETRLIVHSGAGGMRGQNSFYHMHHNEHYNEVCRKWQEKPDKPLVMGEWWIGGRGGLTRNTTGFSFRDRNGFIETVAGLYRNNIIEQRTQGVRGIMPYCYIGYVFEPLFDYRTKLTLPDNGYMEPQPDYLAPYGIDAGGAKELVNPGWDSSLPAFRMNENLKQAFRNGFAPLAAFIRERDENFRSSGLLKKTIVILNDTADKRALRVYWRFLYKGDVWKQGSQPFILDNGECTETALEFTLPVLREDQKGTLEVWLQEGNLKIHEDSLTLNLLADKEIHLNTASIDLYDIKGNTAELFNKLKIPYRLVSLEDVRCGLKNKCLIIGAYSSNPELNLLEDEIFDYVQQGGKVWLMQQAEPVAWLPVKLGFASCVVQTLNESVGLGLQQTPTSRGSYYSWYVPVYAKGHPVFEGIPDLITRWKDHDGRVVDDIYIKPAASGDKRMYNLRTLSGGTSKEHMTAAEIFAGEGEYLLTQYKIAENALMDPISQRLLFNIVSYLTNEGQGFIPKKTSVIGETTRKKIKELYNIDLTSFKNEDMDKYEKIILGSEQEWDSRLENQLNDWISRGGEILVLEREPGSMTFYGNLLTICDSSLLMDSLHFRKGFPITWGMYGTDTEISDGEGSVSHAILINDAAYERIRLAGKPISPLADLVRKNKISWWKDMPINSVGHGMLQVTVGKGTVTLCQLDIFRGNKISYHFARTLFTNLGIQIPIFKSAEEAVSVLKAEEIRIDGDIEEWISDMEDTNVSRWKHAQPMLLAAYNAYTGSVRDNSDCSGVVYLMHDNNNLYVAAQIIDDKICSMESESGDHKLESQYREADGLELNIDSVKIRLKLANQGRIDAAKVLNGKETCLDSCSGVWKGVNQSAFKRNRDALVISSGVLNPYFSGYSLECAIPISKLQEIQWGQKEHELQIDIIDVDSPGEEAARLCYPINRKKKVKMLLVED